jgi:predicted nucleic acid-binding protein
MKLVSLSNFLINHKSALVIDTSVAINLNSTKYVEKILSALPHPCFITNNVCIELAGGIKNGHKDHLIVQELVSKKMLALTLLGSKANSTYLRLIEGGVSSTLDDGEAATIALADEVRGIAVIDERKARLLSKELFPGLEVLSTVDLLTSKPIRDLLGDDGCAVALMDAFIGARMQVPIEKIDIVVDLLGSERLALCTSLPKVVRAEKVTRVI